MSGINDSNPWQYTADPPPPPSPPPTPTPRSWWRRRWIPVAGLLALVLAVVAGHLAWPSPEPEIPAAQRAPFYRAVQSLFTEPVVNYRSAPAAGAPGWDLKVTGDGAVTGEVHEAGTRIPVLVVDGRTYVKPPTSLLGSLPGGTSGESLDGKWVTGVPSLSRLVPQGVSSPADLATRLWAALEDSDFPAPSDPGTRVGSQKALAVRTAEGVLYVSAEAPYRVLRLDPSATAGSPRADAVPAALRAGVPALDLAAATGPLDLGPSSSGDVDRTYAELIERTGELSGAVDLGVDFNFNQTGNLNCSESCTVTENVTTRTTAKPGVKVSGTVTAVMNAEVTVNGRAGGGCSQSATLPVDGSGTMTCLAAGTAPVVAQIRAEKQREADQQAQATGRSVNLQYSLDFRARVRITAMAVGQAELDRTVQAQRKQRDAAVKQAERRADCAGTGRASAPGVRSQGATAVRAGLTPRVLSPAEAPTPGQDCTTTVYRVQSDHPDSKRLVVDKNGNVSVQGNGNLYLNMSGDITHSQAFRGGSGQIIAFDVPSSRVTRLLDAALPQRMPRGYPGTRREWNQARKNAPEIADPKVSPGLIGLPTDLIDEFIDSIVPGSGRIIR
ncbi:hypothetical protein [Kitasatospora aureofaciens]|uniref:hypothetical protein n=1 Tax=Kitasatospora aureofaciens TaxID=1894 RepID=UPI0036F4911C